MKEDIPSIATTWVDLKHIVPNKMDRERQVLYDITYIWDSEKAKPVNTEGKMGKASTGYVLIHSSGSNP